MAVEQTRRIGEDENMTDIAEKAEARLLELHKLKAKTDGVISRLSEELEDFIAKTNDIIEN
jgi:hypothetical protein